MKVCERQPILLDNKINVRRLTQEAFRFKLRIDKNCKQKTKLPSVVIHKLSDT